MHLKTSLTNIRRYPFQAMAAISVLALTFFVATITAVAIYASSQLLHYFETRPQIIAFIQKDANQADIDALHKVLLTDSRIKDVKSVTQQQAAEIYKDANSDNPLLGEFVSPSSLPPSLEFSVVDLSFAQEVIDEVKKNGVVEDVRFTASLEGESKLDEVLTRLRTITSYVRLSGLAAVVILAVTSFLVLMVVVGMRIYSRKGEIETLSLVGATRGFIRAPIVLEALHYATLGVLVGWLFATVILMYITPSLLRYLQTVPVLPRDPVEFFTLMGIIFGIELVAGLLIALGGSIIAVSRALSRK